MTDLTDFTICIYTHVPSSVILNLCVRFSPSVFVPLVKIWKATLKQFQRLKSGMMVVDLRTLPLHVGDESLEKCGSFNLVDNVSTWSRIFGSRSRWEAWHDIFMMDSSNPLCTREEERESTDRATSEQCSLISIALRVQPSYQLLPPGFPIITFSPIR